MPVNGICPYLVFDRARVNVQLILFLWFGFTSNPTTRHSNNFSLSFLPPQMWLFQTFSSQMYSPKRYSHPAYILIGADTIPLYNARMGLKNEDQHYTEKDDEMGRRQPSILSHLCGCNSIYGSHRKLIASRRSHR